MIRIDTLGGLRVTRAGAEAEGLLKQRLRAALLIYLALERESTRDSVLAMFWPDRDAERGRHALSQTLYELRKVLGDDWLRTDGDRLLISDDVQTDAAEFERAVEDGRNADAIALYRGPLLAGVYLAESKTFESWVDRRRARLVRAYRRARRQLIDELIAAGEYGQAMSIATHAVDTDPLDDEAQHRLIELLGLTGRRADAIAQYETYARMLAQDQLEPLEETHALIDRIRAGEVPSAAVRSAIPVRPATVSSDNLTTPSPRMAARRWAILAAAAVVLVLAGALGVKQLTRNGSASTVAMVIPTEEGGERKVIAVLPVENLSRKEDEQYFADGMHEEIITYLCRISGIDVIARQSVMEYRDTFKKVRQIGEELGANVVLASSVRRERDSVRITVRLVDAGTDRLLWTHDYDRPLTDVFAIQADVARRVADELQVYLDPVEVRRMEHRPLASPEAYDAYLRGIDYYGRGIDEKNYGLALQQLERATKLDPEFAEAYAATTMVNVSVYQLGWDASNARRDAAKLALDRAMALDPRAASFARYRYHYYALRDYDGALALIDSAEATGMSRAGANWERGLVLRRMGDYQASTRLMESAIRLNPRHANWHFNLGLSYAQLRQYDHAIAELERAIELAPDWNVPKMTASEVYLTQGKLAAARARLDGVQPGGGAGYNHLLIDLAERRYDQALERAQSMPRISVSQSAYFPKSMLEAVVHRLDGRFDVARTKYSEALTLLDSASKSLPNDTRITGSLAHVYAGLGRKDDALRELRKATAFTKADDVGHAQKIVLAQAMATAYVLLGDFDAAIDQLQYLLSVPSTFSATRITIDPMWDPIRKHPRYAALLAGKK